MDRTNVFSRLMIQSLRGTDCLFQLSVEDQNGNHTKARNFKLVSYGVSYVYVGLLVGTTFVFALVLTRFHFKNVTYVPSCEFGIRHKSHLDSLSGFRNCCPSFDLNGCGSIPQLCRLKAAYVEIDCMADGSYHDFRGCQQCCGSSKPRSFSATSFHWSLSMDHITTVEVVKLTVEYTATQLVRWFILNDAATAATASITNGHSFDSMKCPRCCGHVDIEVCSGEMGYDSNGCKMCCDIDSNHGTGECNHDRFSSAQVSSRQRCNSFDYDACNIFVL